MWLTGRLNPNTNKPAPALSVFNENYNDNPVCAYVRPSAEEDDFPGVGVCVSLIVLVI